MLKKSYFSLLMTLTVAPAWGMSTSESQIEHINNELSAIKRALNVAKIQIKRAQVASPTLYASVKPVLERALARSEVLTQLQTTVNTQFEAIANRNMSFNSLKTTFNFSTFFPKITILDYGKNLFSSMAQKQCCLLLGQKLAQKRNELKNETVVQE